MEDESRDRNAVVGENEVYSVRLVTSARRTTYVDRTAVGGIAPIHFLSFPRIFRFTCMATGLQGMVSPRIIPSHWVYLDARSRIGRVLVRVHLSHLQVPPAVMSATMIRFCVFSRCPK